MKNFLLSLIVGAAVTATAHAQPRQLQVPPNDPDRPLIDVESYVVSATFLPQEHRFTGVAEVHFKQLDRQSSAVFDLDRRLRVSSASIGGRPVGFRQFDLDSTVEFDMRDQQFAGDPVLHVEYAGVLNPEEDRRDPILSRVSETSAFLLYDAKWFPTNGLRRDKAAMLVRVTTPAGWTVVSDMPAIPGEANTFGSKEPSYWGTVAAGEYTAKSINSEKAEVVVNTLKAPEDTLGPMVEAAGKILDFYTATFGPPIDCLSCGRG